MDQNEDEVNILKEKDFILISDKNNEYKMKLFIDNNDLFCLTAFNQSKKYSISLTMNDLIKNRFFKIFVNLEEIFRELENKIEKSILIEDTNLIYLDIPIGLNVINDIILEIKESKKSNEEIIQELTNELNNKNNLIKEQENKINELEKKLKENEIKLNENNEKFNNEIQILKNKIEKNNKELEINELIIKYMNLDYDMNEIINELMKYYENIIEIELETKENNKEIKIINNNNLFKKEDTILFINRNKINFNNIIKFDKIGNYKLLLLNNNKFENLNEMFKDCNELIKIKFYKFNTENVTNMSSMFSNCSSLISIDISKFKTNKVTDMSFMFNECSNLNNLDVSNFNTENVKSSENMFYNCPIINKVKSLNNFNNLKDIY